MGMAMRDEWTDERLDDLNGKVGEGFQRVEADIRALRSETTAEFRAVRTETKTEFRELRGEMNERFDRLDARFDAMQRTLIVSFGGIVVALLGVLVSMVATTA